MHKNYYLFAQLLQELKPQILGQKIERIFTFRKNELVLALQNQTHFRISVAPSAPYFLLSPQQNIKQPALDLFPELKGQTILNVVLKEFDKYLILETEKYALETIFFGSRPNCLLFDQGHHLISTFKEDGRSETENPSFSEKQLSLADFNEKELQERWDASVAQKETFLRFLKKNFAALNKILLNEIYHRSGIDGSTKMDTIEASQASQAQKTFLEISKELTDGFSYLYASDQKMEQVQHVSVLRLFHLKNDHKFTYQQFESLNKALSIFYFKKQFVEEFNRLKTHCQRAIERRLKFVKNSLEKLEATADLEQRKEEAEIKGNLLLIFKNQIPKGARQVELENIFSPVRKPIKIKLNPSKSVAANAERYFNKYKNLNHYYKIYQIKKDTLQKEKKELQELKQRLEQIDNHQRLRRFSKQLKAMGFIQSMPGEQVPKATGESLKYAFNRVIIDKVWDVYIGKGGENNELLTFVFANKWDLWLHAQGVPGAHVIIRIPQKNQLPPPHVIEQAAQIAATHSKARHSSTVPVMYTQVRYVSRVRKAPPGTVKVQNEKVIFVKPLELN